VWRSSPRGAGRVCPAAGPPPDRPASHARSPAKPPGRMGPESRTRMPLGEPGERLKQT
jgi:hypothetical protein